MRKRIFSDSSGNLDLLIKQILIQKGITINLKQTKEKEVKAYLGSIYALLRIGASLDDFEKRIINKEYTKYFREARKLFEQAK